MLGQAPRVFDRRRTWRVRAEADYLLPPTGISVEVVLRTRLTNAQEDSPDTLHLIAVFLLIDGRRNEVTFEAMNKEGAFARLVELIQGMQAVDAPLHRLLLQLLYEMSRIQRIRMEDLSKLHSSWLERR